MKAMEIEETRLQFKEQMQVEYWFHELFKVSSKAHLRTQPHMLTCWPNTIGLNGKCT